MARIIPAARVMLWGKQVGAVAWDDGNKCAAFQYDEEFAKGDLNVSPFMMRLDSSIEYKFPDLQEEPYMGLPGLLADALPDRFGHDLINGWLAQNGIAEADFSPIDRLCYVGSRAMGALEFLPPKNENLEESVKINIKSLVDVVGQVMQSKEIFRAVMVENKDTVLNLLSIGTSAGGARAKALLAINEDTLEVRSGQVTAPAGYRYWLIKFDGVKDDKLRESTEDGRMEYAYYKMATAAGIEMKECKLLEENGRAHFLTERFDRTENGEKIHKQSLASLKHFEWKRPGYVGYEQLFQTAQQLGLGMPAIEQCFRRMIFNILARNHDDHSKNQEFLMDSGGQWSLAPAYDLTFSFDPDGQYTDKHQMTLAGKQDGFERDDIFAVAEKFSIKKPDEIFEQVSTAVNGWPKFADDAGVNEELADKIGKLMRRF